MRMIILFSLTLLSLIDESAASGLNVFFGDLFRQNIVRNSSDVCTEMNKIVDATNAKFTVISTKIADLERKLDDLLRTMSSPTAKLSNSTCPTGFEYYYQEKFCYRFNSDCRTWAEARKNCQQLGGDLISLTEVNFLYFRDVSRSKAGACGGVWVGTTDASSEGQWFWLNGVKVRSVFWAQDQPDNWASKENCGDLSKFFGYKMNDEDCSNNLHFICQSV